MRYIGNKKGVALVTSLMFTSLALVITMALLYMVTSGIKTSGVKKVYKTTTDAAYGGVDIVVKDLVSYAAFAGFSEYSSNHAGTTFKTYMKNTYMASLGNPDVSDCMRFKLRHARSEWGACSASFDLKDKPDIMFDLKGGQGSDYTIYSKIVDTLGRTVMTYDATTKSMKAMNMVGNSDTLALELLEGAAVTELAATTVPHFPYMYRIEVQGERKKLASDNTPTPKSNISVQYAY
jgi:hypothetical protein